MLLAGIFLGIAIASIAWMFVLFGVIGKEEQKFEKELEKDLKEFEERWRKNNWNS